MAATKAAAAPAKAAPANAAAPATANGYKTTDGSGKGAGRHPAHAYANIADPEGYRAYCAALGRHALTGAGGAMEALGTLKSGLRKNDQYPWSAKQRAMWIIRRAHRKYAGAERSAAKAAVRMVAARQAADNLLVEAAAKKKTRSKAGMYSAGNGRK